MTDVYLTVDRRDYDGALQVSINSDGIGYRIAGPKYDGKGRELLRKTLDKSDADAIRSYLRKVRP